MYKFFSLFAAVAILLLCQGCTTFRVDQALAADGTLTTDARAQIDQLLRDDETGTIVIGLTNTGGATPEEIQNLKEATISYFVQNPKSKGKKLEIEFRPDLAIGMQSAFASAGDYTKKVFTPVWEMTPEQYKAAKDKDKLVIYGSRGGYGSNDYVVVSETVGTGSYRKNASAGAGAYAGNRESVRIYRTNHGLLRVTTREYYMGAQVGAQVRGRIRVESNPYNGEMPTDRRMRQDFDDRHNR